MFPGCKQIGHDEAAAAYVDEVVVIGFGEGGSCSLGYGGVGGAMQAVLGCQGL